ncbi:MAG: T9SS type A sorting domain-containing protein [Bacteroidales bacterium]|nr:T9SS type A sorting domain-containing protein [Bacteroidales bacterium]
MKKILLFSQTAVFLSICFTCLYAQNSVLPSGGEITGSNGSLSYSCGQLITTTVNCSTTYITHGVQQPYEISVITHEDMYGQEINLSICPNPVSNILILSTGTLEYNLIRATLYDFNGRLLEVREIYQNESLFDMQELTSAIYFLKVSKNGNEIKTFKIIKN